MILKHKKFARAKAFSLIEVIVSLGVTSCIFAGGFVLLRKISGITRVQDYVHQMNLNADSVLGLIRQDVHDTFLIRPRCNPAADCANDLNENQMAQCNIENCGFANCVQSAPTMALCSDIKLRGGLLHLRGLNAQDLQDFEAVPHISSSPQSSNDGFRVIQLQTDRPIHCRVAETPALFQEFLKVNVAEDPSCEGIRQGDVFAVIQRFSDPRFPDDDSAPLLEFSNIVQATSALTGLGDLKEFQVSPTQGFEINQNAGMATALVNDRSILMGPLKFAEWSVNSATNKVQRRVILPSSSGYESQGFVVKLDKVLEFQISPFIQGQTSLEADRFVFDSLNAPLQRAEGLRVNFFTYLKPLPSGSDQFSHAAAFRFERTIQ